MTAFTRSLRSIQADGFSGTAIALAACVLLLSAWTAWALLATVTVDGQPTTPAALILQSVHGN